MNDIRTLFLLALPVACVSWTLTHEEILREPREWCAEKSRTCRPVLWRKFFYAFTCEYCLSHYVAAAFVLLVDYHLLAPGWRGLLVGWLSVVWVANLYMGVFGRLRLEIKHERVEIEADQEKVQRIRRHPGGHAGGRT
jgi:hypothetical protein